jgi:hypothetical protein
MVPVDRVSPGDNGDKIAAVKLSATPADGSIEIDLVVRCLRVRGIVHGTILWEVLAALVQMQLAA